MLKMTFSGLKISFFIISDLILNLFSNLKPLNKLEMNEIEFKVIKLFI